MNIDPLDLIVTVYSKGGSPWLHTPATFVTLYHKPTGITTTSEGEGSLHKNQHIALEKLCAMIIEREEQLCWELYSEDVKYGCQ